MCVWQTIKHLFNIKMFRVTEDLALERIQLLTHQLKDTENERDKAKQQVHGMCPIYSAVHVPHFHESLTVILH